MLQEATQVLTWVDRLSSNWDLMIEGGMVLAVISHAINEFPVPDNKYGRWLLGVFQFAVGFRNRAGNTVKNQDTVTVPMPKKNGNGNGTGTGGGSTENPSRLYQRRHE